MSLLNTFENRYIYLRSGPTRRYPGNKPYNFTVDLPSVLEFDDHWMVSLLNIIYQNPPNMETILQFYVDSNIVAPSCDTDYLRRVIAAVPLETRSTKRICYEPHQYQYTKVSPSEIRNITIYIKDELEQFITYFKKDIVLTLLFRRMI